MSRFAASLILLVACGPPSEPAGTSAADVPVELPHVAPGRLPEAALRRLTEPEYLHSLTDLFGPELALTNLPEPDEVHDGLAAIGASTSTVSAVAVEAYEGAAWSVADQLAGPLRDRVLTCAPAGSTDDACATATLSAVGRRLWRRPLTATELDRLVALHRATAAEAGDFHVGLGVALAAMLASPHFLYHVELGHPDGGDPATVHFDDLELASRLSFALWASTPDDPLLDAALAGGLSQREGLARQVDRMLADPRARRGVATWVQDLLHLDGLDTTSKYVFMFPEWTPDLAAAARAQVVETILRHAWDADADWRDVLVTRETVMNDALAPLYGVAPPGSAALVPYTLPAAPRRTGLLGQVALLALHAHASSTSVTRRGRFVREALLCDPIDPPPPGVVTFLGAAPGADQSARARAEFHAQNPGCAGCHAATDPLGLALENFDAIGRWRDVDGDHPIDASGDLDGAPFADAAELSALLRDHPDLLRCTVETLYARMVGHRPDGGEGPAIDELTEAFAASGGSLRSLLRATALHPTFRHAGAPQP